MHYKSLRCVAAALALVAVGLQCWGQPGDAPDEEAKALAPARDTAEARLHLPADVVAKSGLGERLLLNTGSGATQVVKLHCDLGVELLVMLPTGELTLVPRSQTSTTDKPFVPADTAAMKQALTAAGFGKFKMESALTYLFV